MQAQINGGWYFSRLVSADDDDAALWNDASVSPSLIGMEGDIGQNIQMVRTKGRVDPVHNSLTPSNLPVR